MHEGSVRQGNESWRSITLCFPPSRPTSKKMRNAKRSYSLLLLRIFAIPVLRCFQLLCRVSSEVVTKKGNGDGGRRAGNSTIGASSWLWSGGVGWRQYTTKKKKSRKVYHQLLGFRLSEEKKHTFCLDDFTWRLDEGTLLLERAVSLWQASPRPSPTA